MSEKLKIAWKTREKRNPWNKGKTLPTKLKQKISQSLRGRVASEETKRKMTESQKKRWQKIKGN